MVRSRLLRGVTLVEVSVVVGILGLLMMIVVPSFGRFLKTRKEIQLRSILSESRREVIRFKSDVGCYPLSIDDLALTTPPPTCRLDARASAAVQINTPAGRWRGPYLKAIPVDPTNYGPFVMTATVDLGYIIRSNNAEVSTDGSAYSSW
jgi:prepilin-type N-terminal cleavage/methylation domain-containing protein